VIVAALTWLLATVLLAVALALAVLVLAGPHGGVRPAAIRPVVVPIAWLLLLVLPAWAAVATWRRLSTRNEGAGRVR
jgi:hypothetical protein